MQRRALRRSSLLTALSLVGITHCVAASFTLLLLQKVLVTSGFGFGGEDSVLALPMLPVCMPLCPRLCDLRRLSGVVCGSGCCCWCEVLGDNVEHTCQDMATHKGIGVAQCLLLSISRT